MKTARAKTARAKTAQAKLRSARRAAGKPAAGKPRKGKRTPAPEARPSRHEKLARAQAPAAPARPAAPLAEPTPPQIHVTHNRKQHFEPGQQPEPPPRKATTDDFLNSAPVVANEALSAHTAEPEVAAGTARQASGGSHPDSDDERGPRMGEASRLRSGTVPAQRGLPATQAVPQAPAARGPAPQPQVSAPAQPVMAAVRRTAARLQAVAVAEAGLEPVLLLPALYSRSGRLMVPAAMKGSHEILVHQNVMADHDGLDRVRDDDDLEQMRKARLLVPIPESSGLRADERLPANRRYARPWTAQFLSTLAKAHYQRFHSALQVNSAVRTVEFQQRLQRTNGNAAPAEGETASPHLTGQAVDLAKKGMTLAEIAWMRGYLTPLVQAGKVDVEEEFQQSCFHISVYRSYAPEPAVKRVATARRGGGSSPASAMR